MNPQGKEHLPSLELPRPATEQIVQGSEVVPWGPVNERQSSVAVEQGLGPQASVPQTVALPSANAAVPPVQTPQSSAVPLTGSHSTTPAIAEDTDLIEKEWVEKAKEIVEKTKNDPYLQNQEINKVKADYMKKRYNKDMKLA